MWLIASALLGAVEHIKNHLVGKEPRQIEKHYHDIYRDAYWCGGAVFMSVLSAGERLYTRFDYNELFRRRACDYIQPDVSHAGGIMELKKIAAIAEANYIPFAPHNPSGPVANAATLQLATSCPNFAILEIMYSDVEWRADVTNENIIYENGRIKIGDRPGLGIEINEEESLKHPYVEHNLRHYTGALTDIRPAKTKYYF